MVVVPATEVTSRIKTRTGPAADPPVLRGSLVESRGPGADHHGGDELTEGTLLYHIYCTVLSSLLLDLNNCYHNVNDFDIAKRTVSC